MMNDLAERFRILTDEWKKRTMFLSNVSKIAQDPAYQEIIAMGEAAIPLILKELEHDLGHWFIALSRITGANPIPKASAGKVQEMAEAWLSWGREKGYIVP